MKRARKSSRKVPNGELNVDRLSALPEGVICHILSFLPIQISVQTSILAKRWRFLWAHVPLLDFDYEKVRSKSTRFPGIVNMVMLRHKVQSLNTCRLTYNGDDNGPCYELETCIAIFVERNVQNLHLDLRVEAPRCLLTCKTLVDLTMFNDVSIPPTAPISLPNLKKLRLWRLHCEVDFTRLLSACPVLEELIINETTCRDPGGCCISSPTLKRLTIDHLLDFDMFDNPDYMVTINTPALRYLKVDDRLSKHISISLCTYLVEADIFIYYLCEGDDFYRRSVLKLLDSIRNVKCLSMSGSCAEICDWSMPGSMVKFDNLTKLELCAPWCLLTKFLESADHLQVLTIFEDHSFLEHSFLEHWRDPVEERLLRSLRTVIVKNFGCKEQSFNMVRYILRNAQVLERMEINCSEGLDLKEKFDAIRKISLFHRESKKCELDFS